MKVCWTTTSEDNHSLPSFCILRHSITGKWWRAQTNCRAWGLPDQYVTGNASSLQDLCIVELGCWSARRGIKKEESGHRSSAGETNIKLFSTVMFAQKLDRKMTLDCVASRREAKPQCVLLSIDDMNTENHFLTNRRRAFCSNQAFIM